eukprot:COSAG02_NODE_910_length_16005_cov_46.458569_2_plen_34_part_00
MCMRDRFILLLVPADRIAFVARVHVLHLQHTPC